MSPYHDRQMPHQLHGEQSWVWTLTPLARLLLFKQLAAMADEHELEDKAFRVPAGFRPDRHFLLEGGQNRTVELVEVVFGWWEDKIKRGEITDRDIQAAKPRYFHAYSRLPKRLQDNLEHVNVG